MTAGTPEERFREKLAEWIGYEMACEGKKTGTQISHGVAARMRQPENRELVLRGMGEVREWAQVEGEARVFEVTVHPRGEATDG